MLISPNDRYGLHKLRQAGSSVMFGYDSDFFRKLRALAPAMPGVKSITDRVIAEMVVEIARDMDNGILGSI